MVNCGNNATNQLVEYLNTCFALVLIYYIIISNEEIVHSDSPRTLLGLDILIWQGPSQKKSEKSPSGVLGLSECPSRVCWT